MIDLMGLWGMITFVLLAVSLLMYFAESQSGMLHSEERVLLSRVILFCWAWPVVVAFLIVRATISVGISGVGTLIKDADMRGKRND